VNSIIDDIRVAITSQDTRHAVKIMFESTSAIPKIRAGFGHERTLWDFKNGIPSSKRSERASWVKISADVLAFHNADGGILIFGIEDHNFCFSGCKEQLDSKQFNDKIRHYLGDRIYVYFSREFIQVDQKYLGIAIIPPRKSEILRFVQDGITPSGEIYFSKGDIALRENDETRIYRGSEATNFLIKQGVISVNSLFSIDQPGYKILAPDYCNFIYRADYCKKILESLRSRRTFITALTGIGGVGKTALACWALNEMYTHKEFEYIVSISAKDRELTSSGIVAIKPMLTSYVELLDQILDTIGYLELVPKDEEEKEQNCKDLMKNESILLLVDNLETVDDPRIIKFLENLPEGVKAIVTSRKLRVKVAAMPIEIGPFSDKEAIDFFDMISLKKNKRFLMDDFSKTVKQKIVANCDHIPLVIEWFIGRARSSSDASDFSDLLLRQNVHSEKLLDFCFRNIYSKMDSNLRSCLEVLATFDRPLPIEAISVASKLPIGSVLDAIDDLRDYALLESRYDEMYRDNCYYLLPVTKAFVKTEVRKDQGKEERIRRELSKWYDAENVKDPNERELLREIRRGGVNPELTIVELAKQKRTQGDLETAERLFKLAIGRNPKSWSALRELGEFYRHERRSVGDALRLYEQAAPFVPKRGAEKALFYREWGMISRQEGLGQSHENAIEKFEIALKENPDDKYCRFALGQVLFKVGKIIRAIEVLEVIAEVNDSRGDEIRQLLYDCYMKKGELLKAAEMKKRIDND